MRPLSCTLIYKAGINDHIKGRRETSENMLTKFWNLARHKTIAIKFSLKKDYDTVRLNILGSSWMNIRKFVLQSLLSDNLYIDKSAPLSQLYDMMSDSRGGLVHITSISWEWQPVNVPWSRGSRQPSDVPWRLHSAHFHR